MALVSVVSDIDSLAALQANAVSAIYQVETLNRELTKLLGASLLTTIAIERAEHDLTAAHIASEVYTRIEMVSNILKTINGYTVQHAAETVLLAQQVHKAVNVQYVEVLRSFFNTYADHQTHKKKLLRQQYVILHPGATDEEMDGLGSVDAVLNAAVKGEVQAAKDALKYVKSRHQDCLKIEAQLLDLKQLMDMLAILTEAQSHIVEEVETNIIVVKSDVKSGLSRVKKSR